MNCDSSKHEGYFDCYRGAHIFKISGIRLKFLGARNMTTSKSYAQDRQILGATLQNIVAAALGARGVRLFCTVTAKCTIDLLINYIRRYSLWVSILKLT